MIPLVRNIIHYLRDSDYKKALSRRTNLKRDNWEKRWKGLVQRMLNKQIKELASHIDQHNYNSNNLGEFITTEPVRQMMLQLYKTVGGDFAEFGHNQILKRAGLHLERELKQTDYDSWYAELQWYVNNKVGNRIVSITSETRKQAIKIIREAVGIGLDEGIGAEELALQIQKQLIKKGTEINKWRSLRIARTEVMTASNIGTQVGASSTDLPLEKYWVATYDNRTRDTHLVVEEQNPKRMDEGFRVGAYLMEMPGDPDAGPEEVINCRCVIAHEVANF